MARSDLRLCWEPSRASESLLDDPIDAAETGRDTTAELLDVADAGLEDLAEPADSTSTSLLTFAEAGLKDLLDVGLD